MPQSRKRHIHHDHHQPATASPKQKTKGRITWAILFGVFGLLISFFAAADNYFVLIIGTLIGAAIGYTIGKNMEAATRK